MYSFDEGFCDESHSGDENTKEFSFSDLELSTGTVVEGKAKRTYYTVSHHFGSAWSLPSEPDYDEVISVEDPEIVELKAYKFPDEDSEGIECELTDEEKAELDGIVENELTIANYY